MLPSRVGGYEVTGELGRGGMGRVLRARDPREGHEVAIKLLLGARGADEGRRRRFAREAEALARLRHPGIVAVLGAGEEQGCPFVVLEYVDGGSLEERLAKQGPLAPEEAVSLARCLADALQHAHAHGLVHRDVKPANVLLAPGGPKLTDFGLVKDLDPSRSHLSHTGCFLGTPGFMAPEQAAGEHERVDARTDVWGLGATLYAALTGAPPVRGDHLVQVLVATRDQPIEPPSRLRPDVPPALDAVVLRCLAKAPADRFASAAEVARALEAGPGRGGARWGVRRRPALLAAACAGVTLAAVVAWRGAGYAHEREASGAPAVAPAATASLADVAPPASAAAPPGGAGAPLERAEDELALGRARRVAKDFVAAQGHFEQAVALDPEHGQAWLELGLIRQALQDDEGALRDLDRAAALRPGDAVVFYHRGLLKVKLGDPTGALADHERAVELAPTWALAWSGRAGARADLGDARGAVADYTKALEIDPTPAHTWYNRGLVRGRLNTRGELRKAIEDFTQALEREPDMVAALVDRGAGRARLDQDEAALADFDRALELAPDHVAALCNRGVVRVRLEDYRGGIDDYTRALELDPTMAPVHMNRGVARKEFGDVEGAIADFERFLELAPDHAKARNAREELERLRRPR